MKSAGIIIATRGIIQDSDDNITEGLISAGHLYDSSAINRPHQYVSFYSRATQTITYVVHRGYYNPMGQPPLGDR